MSRGAGGSPAANRSATPALAAPREDGAILAVPPLDQCPAILAENHLRLAAAVSIGGRSLAQLRQAARAALLQEATVYLREAGEPIPLAHGPLVFLGGHQPEMFHPGVWLKQFALAGLSRRHGGAAVNLIVDSDSMKSASLRVPTPADQHSAYAHLHTILFDHWQHEVPYEMCRVRDEELFASFGRRIEEALQPWTLDPLIRRFWPMVEQQRQRTPLLGERLVAARRALEREWGCHNFEVPLSRLCRTEPFVRFACHLLASTARLHGVYNDCVRAHRRRHHLRSRNHPVPDLAVEGDWLEVPLWAWRSGDQRRRRLFARVSSSGIDLRAGGETWPRLPCEPDSMVQSLLEMIAMGYSLRTRALITAMFARLLLGDLFMHGIGGAKYDELTDEIIRQFFHIDPPQFLVMSGTLRLPLPRFERTQEEWARLRRDLRDLTFNPQRHADDGDGDALKRLAQEKQDLVARRSAIPPRERHGAFKRLNREMAPYLADAHERLRNDLEVLRRQLSAADILLRRDYAFCLFPEATLRPFCSRVL